MKSNPIWKVINSIVEFELLNTYNQKLFLQGWNLFLQSFIKITIVGWDGYPVEQNTDFLNFHIC